MSARTAPRLAPSAAAAMIAALAALVAAVPGGALPSPVTIDADAAVPFAFNAATVSGRDGFSGSARLYGEGVDGNRELLFEAVIGYADSVRATYYAWPELSSLSFEGLDGNGAAISGTVKARLANPGPEAEALAGHGFPFRLMPLGGLRRSAPVRSLNAGEPETAARTALSELFAAGRRPIVIAALALWSIAAAAYAATADRRRGNGGTTTRRTGSGHENDSRAGLGAIIPPGARQAAPAILAVAAMTAAAFALGAAPAGLYAAAIPGRATGDADGALVLDITDHGPYRSYAWAAAGPKADDTAAAGLRFIGIRSPLSAAIPVSAFDGYRLIRFKKPPVIVPGPDGGPSLAAAPFAVAWGLHE